MEMGIFKRECSSVSGSGAALALPAPAPQRAVIKIPSRLLLLFHAGRCGSAGSGALPVRALSPLGASVALLHLSCQAQTRPSEHFKSSGTWI